MVKNWSPASKIAVGRQEKLVCICLQVSSINEYTDAALNKNHGRSYEQERAGASPNFVPIMWFSGNEKSGHCSHALSPEDWLCPSICVKCWTGSFHSGTGSVTTAQLGGHLGNKTRSGTLFPPAPGSWDVLVQSGTSSQTCQSHQHRMRWQRMRNSVEWKHHGEQCPSGAAKERKEVLAIKLDTEYPLCRRKHRRNSCWLPGGFSLNLSWLPVGHRLLQTWLGQDRRSILQLHV